MLRQEGTTQLKRLGKKLIPAGLVLILALAAMPVVSAASAEKVVNGGFEQPDVVTWSVFSSIPGWEKTYGCGIEVQDGVAGAPYEGEQHVELGSNCASGMSQMIATRPGVAYVLSFAFSPRPNSSASNNVLDVTWDGVVVDTLSRAGGSQTAWTVHTYTVVASGTSTALTFEDKGVNDSLGTYVDAVSVKEVEYNVCALYDQSKAHKAGSTVPIKLQLCDAAGNNISSPDYVLNAFKVSKIDNSSDGIVEDSGAANPDDNFRYSADLGEAGGYIFNKSLRGFTSGTWVLSFTVNGGETVYSVQFDVK